MINMSVSPKPRWAWAGLLVFSGLAGLPGCGGGSDGMPAEGSLSIPRKAEGKGDSEGEKPAGKSGPARNKMAPNAAGNKLDL